MFISLLPCLEGEVGTNSALETSSFSPDCFHLFLLFVLAQRTVSPGQPTLCPTAHSLRDTKAQSHCHRPSLLTYEGV